MMNFKVIGKLDPAPLLERLSHHQAHWGQGGREYYEGSAHAQAQSIMIRWVKLPTEDLVAAQVAETAGERRALANNLLDEVLNSTESVDQPAARTPARSVTSAKVPSRLLRYSRFPPRPVT